MLPTFPAARKKLEALFEAQMRNRVQFHLGELSGYVTRAVREGGEASLVRDNEEEIETKFHRISVETTWKKKTPDAHLSIEEAFQQVDEMAKKLAYQKAKMVFEELDRQLPPERTIDAQGRELDGKLLEEMIEGIWIDFDENDQPIMPTIFATPEFSEKFRGKTTELSSDPAARKRFDWIIERKREEFYARKASKRLVS